VATEAEFRAGRRLSVRRSDDASRARALSHDATAPGRRYNLLTNNCEHTVHRMTSGRAHSPQLRGWVAGVGLAAAALALTRRPGLAAAGYALGRRLGDALGRTLARDSR
jgi:hypothetical protein